MSPWDFANELLALIRRTFFAEALDSDFYKERNLLLQAIAFPAARLKTRFPVNTPDSLSRSILSAVIETIKTHGAKKRDRFSVYFLFCVQKHMDHTARNTTTRQKPPGARSSRCRSC
jgi:hypothetical protein